MSCERWIRHAGALAIPNASAWTSARSLSLAISICGHISTTSRSTSRAHASLPTTRSSKASMASFALSASRLTGSWDSKTPAKSWRLGVETTRATTAQRDREQTPDCVALRPRRIQSARSETGRKLCARMVQSWVAPQTGRLLKIALVPRNQEGQVGVNLMECPGAYSSEWWAPSERNPHLQEIRIFGLCRRQMSVVLPETR
jgi:hypothetical protein